MPLRVAVPRADGVRVKLLALRRADTCANCSAELSAGAQAHWDATAKRILCLSCGPAVQPVALPPSVDMLPQSATAGGSAQREYVRRATQREQRVRERHPRLGGLLLALVDEPTSTRVWAQGAAGERAVGAALEGFALDEADVLHDRRMRRPDGRLSRANIDHLVIVENGVWVVDAKTHQGQLEVRRSGGLLRPQVERLYIRGRDQTALVEGVKKQVAVVTAELEAVEADVPVHAALCFVGTDLPWFGSSSIDGTHLVGRRRLIKLLRTPGDLGKNDRQSVYRYLASRFPAA